MLFKAVKLEWELKREVYAMNIYIYKKNKNLCYSCSL